MSKTADTTRLTELKSALRQRVETMDGITNAFKVEGNNVEVTPRQRDNFRKALNEANEIKGLIADLEQKADMRAFLDAPEGGARATAAEAEAAQYMLPAKSLGALFTESQEFKALLKSGAATMPSPFEINGVDAGAMSGYGQKDVFTGSVAASSTRGFGTVQRDPMVPRQFRTQRVRDLFPVAATAANLIDYFRVSGFTNNAAPVAERSGAAFGLKPQSTLSFAVAQAPVRTLAHYEVAHRNVLDDEPQLRATIDNELLYGLRLTEDAQILNGTGTGEDLLGILNTPGIQAYTQANNGATPPVATETKPDAIRRAATRSILAYYDPTGVVLHPYDWEDIELQKDSNGSYIVAGNVAIGAQTQIWRMPVVDTPAIAEGTFLIGSFGLGAQLYDRMVASIRIAEQHADFFIRNAVAILAEERLALAVKRPESFVKGTFVG